MHRLPYIVALAFVSSGVALADKEDQRRAEKVEMSKWANSTDRNFVDKAAADGTAEVTLAKLAMDRAQSMEVKNFARKMLEDHNKANTELKQIADKKGVNVPTTLDDKHQRVYEKLAKLSGDEFDREYIKAMTEDHDDAVTLFRNETEKGQDADLKSFAMKTLPVLEKHDDMAHIDKEHLESMKKMPTTK
jgi:putative membrane protein